MKKAQFRNAVKIDVIFPDELIGLGILRFPPLFPLAAFDPVAQILMEMAFPIR